jgi:hypothetical protein
MLYESDHCVEKVEKNRNNSNVKESESEERKEHDSPRSSKQSAPFVSKFDVLIEKLKAKLNADNFFNYLQVQ